VFFSSAGSSGEAFGKGFSIGKAKAKAYSSLGLSNSLASGSKAAVNLVYGVDIHTILWSEGGHCFCLLHAGEKET
jgi:hypothetical protein